MSVLEVAHRFLGTSIKLGDFCWNSPSISRPKHNKSSPGLSGNSKVRSPLEAKPISLFDLERRSLLHRLTGTIPQSKKECFSVKGPKVIFTD